MVKTEDADSMVDGWREVFERSRFVPPHSQTVRRAAESRFTQSRGFQLSLSRVTAAHLPQENSEADQGVTYQLRANLFDTSLQHFFGKTWKSSPQKLKNNKISFNEVNKSTISTTLC
ncbi:hypothetical protein LDENG_00154400 [Lucifuga dentata]|nr:hypothetical protein LDENG_00154400 [Lucifuga dentata]